MTETKHLGIGNWAEDGQSLRLVVTVELRVGDLAGDLAERGFQTVEHEPCQPGTLTLSVTHEVIDRGSRRRDNFVSCGAGLPQEYVKAVGVFDAGWNRAKLARLAELAERWHLNTMRAGCAHQTVEYETDRYSRRVPSLDLTPACPISGYRYGHAWLVEPLPADVEAEIRELASLPAPVAS